MSSTDETIPEPQRGEDPPVRPSAPSQDFKQAHSQALLSGILFEDPEFPCVDSSVFKTRVLPGGESFEWKRPSELCDNPQFFVEGASRFDIVQGRLGDCWLLSSITSLALHKKLFYRVVPSNQEFGRGYAGIFRFNFWQYGEWKEIIVDDRIPTFRGKVVFLHSSTPNEFWSALLEKAFAKLYGSYEALKGGQAAEGMTSLTGGVAESFPLEKSPPSFKMIAKFTQRQSLMCCAIEAKPNEIESKGPNGLVRGHAYSVTAARKVKARTRSGEREVELIRLRNPWGNEREWCGPWSDKSKEWSLLSESEKRSLGLMFEDDGEFWMSYDDFCSNFTILEVCSLGVSRLDIDYEHSWEQNTFSGSWIRGSSAGGCRNFLNTFALNPQFGLSLEDTDQDADNLCSLVVALTQKDRRQLKTETGAKMLTIGFSIYKAPDDGKVRADRGYFAYNASTARCPVYINSAEVVGRYKLPPGEYLIIPSTFKPNEQGDFILRTFTERAGQSEEEQETPSEGASGSVQRIRRPNTTASMEATMDSKFKQYFMKLAGDDKRIDAFEFQLILSSSLKKDLQGRDFSLSASRELVAFFDKEKEGKLTYESFKNAWLSVKKWLRVVETHDQDKSGKLNRYELREILAALGIRLSNLAIEKCMLKYASKVGNLGFDDVFEVIARIQRMSNFISELEKSRSKQVELEALIMGTI